MNLLPHWVLTDKFPAFYDSESKTAIEQTARVYAAMQTLIAEYNSFVDSANQHITDFENGAKKDYEIFTTSIRQEFQDFIDVIDLKVKSQDAVIADAVTYMKVNLSASINAALTELRESGGFSQEVMKVYSDILNQISVLNSRMNTFTALEDGSTTGDAELQDGRTDYTGKVWDNIGSHIRGVTSELSGEIADICDTQTFMYDNFLVEKGSIGSDGTIENTSSSSSLYTPEFIEVAKIKNVTWNEKETGTLYVCYYDSDKNFELKTVKNYNTPGIDSNYAYVRFSGYLNGGITEEIFKSWFTLELRTGLDNRIFNLEKVFNENPIFSKTIPMVKSVQYAQSHDISDLKETIDNMVEIGVDTYCVSSEITVSYEQQVAFESGNISSTDLQPVFVPDISIVNELMSYAENKGMKACTLAVHSNWLRTQFRNGLMSFKELKNIYDTTLTNALSNLTTQFEYVGVYNEFSNDEVVENRNDVLGTFNLVKKYAGVGLSGVTTIDHTLLNNMNVYLPHPYCQPFAFFGMYSTISDAEKTAENNIVWRVIEHIHNYNPHMPIIATEFGTQSYWECLYNPGTYYDGSNSEYTFMENGEPQKFYLNIIMPLMKKYGVNICSYWWELYGGALEYVKKYNYKEILL